MLNDSFSLNDSYVLNDSINETVSMLNEDELKIYNLFLHADNIKKVTLENICQELNLKHRQQAKRLLNK